MEEPIRNDDSERLIESNEESRRRLPFYARLLNVLFCRSGLDDEELEAEPVPLSQLFRFATRKELICTLCGLICTTIGGTLAMGVSFFYGRICTIFLTTKDPIGNDAFFEKLIIFAIVYAVIGTGVALLGYVESYLLNWSSEQIALRIRQRFLESVLSQDAEYIDANTAGSLSSKLNNNIDRIREGVGEKLAIFIHTLVMCITALAIIFHEDYRLAAIAVGAYPISAIFMGIMPRVAKGPTKRALEATEKMDGIAEECIMNVKTIASCNGESSMIEKYKRVLSQSLKAALHVGLVDGSFEGLNFCIGYGFYSATWWWGVHAYHDGRLTDPGKIMLIAQAVSHSSYSFSFLAPHLMAILKSRAAAAIVYQVLDRVPKVDAKTSEGKDPASCMANIEFRNAYFSYSTRDRAVLNGLNWKVNEGETVALVGHSGCGKSTTLSMITRFLECSNEAVLLGGTDIRQFNVRKLRQMVGVVSQEPSLFNGTIRDNIRLGRNFVTEADILRSAQIASAHEFIVKLEKGYDTLIGAGGVSLSGGQQQRISIARAIVTNPRILLLDEATSALDTKSEKEVQNALRKASEGRTTVIVAHRLSTVKDADRVYFLEDGKVVDEGTFDELVNHGGEFARMVEMQNVDLISSDEDAATVKPRRRTTSRRISSSEYPSPRHISTQTSVLAVPTTAHLGHSSGRAVLKLISLYPWKFAALVFVSLLRGLENTFFTMIYRYLMQSIREADYEALLNKSLLALAVLAIYCWIFILTARVTSGWVSERIMGRLRLRCFASLLHRPCEYFDRPETANAACTVTLTQQAPKTASLVDARAGQVFEGVSSAISCLIYSMLICWPNGLLAVSFGSVLFVIIAFVNKHLQSISDKLRATDISGELAIEIFESVRTIQTLSVESYFTERFAKIQESGIPLRKKKCSMKGLMTSASDAYFFMIYALATALGAYVAYAGIVTLPDVYVSLEGVTCTAFAIYLLSVNLNDFIESANAAKQLFALVDDDLCEEDETKSSDSVSSSDSSGFTVVSGRLQAEHISFAYPTRPDTYVTKNVSFEAKPGEAIALVGPSGSGKTTIIQLIERFYDPQQGHMKIDGTSTKNIPKHRLRQRVALVSQQPILFNGTIFENVGLGVPGVTKAEVEAACHSANAAEFIETFPEKYETVVGDSGSGLSGGQKQRIAIARAIIRNPKVMLLDEATSALDSKSEQVVLDALGKTTEGRTSVTVAHRLATIRSADCIYYFEDGRILESGTYENLMAANGKFAQLAREQSR